MKAFSKKFGDRLRQQISLAGISQRQFAFKIGIKPNALDFYLKGRVPDGVLLNKIAQELCVSMHWILTGEDVKSTVSIPVLAKIPAGFPENIEAEGIIEYISLPDAPKNSFAVKVKGESMLPNIKEDDYLIFVNDGDYKTGDIVIVSNEWGESMVKRYRVKNKEVLLVSDNPAFPSFKPNEQYRIIGKVVDVWSRKKP